MSFPRLDDATLISDRLNLLASIVKTRSRASLTDANRILETVTARFFNALFGWNLINLNLEQANYAAVDLGDRELRIAIQVTNEDGSDKIRRTKEKAIEHNLSADFNLVIVFFLLPKKPGFPKSFQQPEGGPEIATWDIADLLKKMHEQSDLQALARAAGVLEEEMGRLHVSDKAPTVDISRIIKYAPAELVGRADELKLLNDAWAQIRTQQAHRPHVLTFVALGGEGKTSLVAKWAAELAAQDWPGCDAAFAWTFYSQGTREQLAASSDLFLKEALTFFGDDADKQFAAGSAGAFEKGQRLARVVGRRPTLLILDGLEPLQYATSSPTPGELTDQGIAALLRALAAASRGLCVVTTRASIPDLKAFWHTTAPEVKLLRLSRDAGVHLLETLGVRKESGTAKEFETLVEDVKGHALTLTLLGGFLRRAFRGDIRQRDRVKFEKADERMDGGHAFRTIAAYEQWLLRDGGDEGQREVAVLRLMGLFDRPADAGCLAAVRSGEPIPGLTESLAKLADDDWEFCLSGLEAAKLVTVIRDATGALVSLDAHPHLREYFANQLREQNPGAWRAAHRRLYEHLCDTAPECTRIDKSRRQLRWLGHEPPTLQDLQPLYQAVAHGCNAGSYQEACVELFAKRINLGPLNYSTKILGAFGTELAAASGFFDRPWRIVNSAVTLEWQSWLLHAVGFFLKATGRLSEAVEPIEASLEANTRASDWPNAATTAINLSGVKVALGQLAQAIDVARQAVEFADQDSPHSDSRIQARAALADALHHAGRRPEAKECFQEAEFMQDRPNLFPNYPLLFSGSGFEFCDLILSEAERSAWQAVQKANVHHSKSVTSACCHEAKRRATQTLKWARREHFSSLSISLDHLTLGRAALYAAILGKSDVASAKPELELTVAGLRRAGQQDELPKALLTRAWLRFLTGYKTGPGSAQEDLDEAWEIAERGPMKLFLADIHLHRARLFYREPIYAWISPQADLDAAKALIRDCGYHRRDEELADAKRAILGKQES